jgi:translocation and assembly module TamB
MRTHSRLRRVLKWVCKGALGLVLFGCLLVAVVLAGLNLPIVRKTVAAQATALIGSELRGTIVIERIGRLDPFGVTGLRVRARDPEGRPVLFADGLDAWVDTWRLVRSLLHGGVIDVEIGMASVEHIDLLLDADASGTLRLLRTVELRKSPSPSPSPSTSPSPGASSGGVRLNVANGFLRHGWVHGRPPGAPPLDAEIRDAAATVSITPDRIDIAVRRAALESRGMPEGADPRGDVSGRIALPSDKAPTFEGNFYGDVGGLQTSFFGRLDGKRLTARLAAWTTENIDRTFASEVPFVAPLVLRADASGTLQKPIVRARARLGEGTVDIDGEVSLGATIRASATLRAGHLDLRDILPKAPGSDINALADGSVVVIDGEPHGEIRLLTEPSRVGSEAIPAVIATGRLNGMRLDARVLAEHRGARAFGVLCLQRVHGEPSLDANVTATIPDLARIPGMPKAVRGRGRVFVEGTLGLETKRVTGHVVADVSDLADGDLGLARGFLDARLDGSMPTPRIDAVLSAGQIAVRKSKFRSGSGHIRGTLARALVAASLEGDEGYPSLAVNARVEMGNAITLRDVSVVSVLNGMTALAGVEVVRIADGDVRIQRAVVVGLGEPVRADAHVARDEIRIRVDSRGVDLRRAAGIVGVSTGRFRGNLAVDVDLVARRSGATGHARVDLTDATFGDGSRGQGHLDARVDRDRISGSVKGTWSGSRIDLRTEDLRLGGPPNEFASWGRAFGKMNIDADVDLGRVRQIVPDGTLPFEEMAGSLRLSLGISRKAAGAMPEATLTAKTSAFRLSRVGSPLEASDGTKVRSPPRWRVSGIDFDLDAATDEDGDEATFHGRIHDEHGTLVDLTFGSPFPPAAVLTDPAQMRDFLETSPMELHLSVPRRKISELPDALGRKTMDGSIELGVDAKGTLRDPKLAVVFDLRDFRAQRRSRTPAAGAHVVARYDGHEGKIDAIVDTAGKRVLSATALGHVNAGDLLAKRADAPWDASAQAKLERLPLEGLPELADQRVKGSVNGDIDVSMGSRGPPHFQAKLDFDPFAVGRFGKNRATVQVDVNERTLKATTRIQQPDGFLAVKGEIGVTWPVLEPQGGASPRVAEPAHLGVQAQNFHLSILRPFVRDMVNRLDGRLDADVQLDVAGHGGSMATRGHVAVREGAFELPTLGEEFQGVRAKATFDPNGIIVVDDIHARGTTGSVSGNAVIHLAGLGFSNAHGNFRVPKNDALPISMEGQLIGDAWGNFHAEVSRSPLTGQTDVKIDVPLAGVRLPDKTTHSIQSLGPAERVRVGIYRAPGQFEVLQGGPIEVRNGSPAAAVRIAVHVNDLEVRRGSDLRVHLEGNPLIKMGRDAGVTGEIVLHEGFLEVEGKRFEIERGTITFTGEADNPEVVVTAGWTAPEGTRVYADFVGPLKTGKVTLRSEPARTNTEILSLILFGTTTGSTSPMAPGTSSADANAQAAAGVGGGFATQGLNRALDDLTGLDVTARVDTSDSANPRPELEVRIARDISVALAHVLGVPPPGTNPDRNLATVDWRFVRNWSLQTTFGDAGSSMLDFVWQYRY